jgi:two-component system nitrogen regulation response regulator NtrX
MIRVNCGAIAPELVDSELFGHEKGSFTGAIATRKGWFERADGGTLFLDEVGELPLAAQVRLLRVLQDGTIERVDGGRRAGASGVEGHGALDEVPELAHVARPGAHGERGGEQSIRVSVRIVSATNRQLSELIAEGKFRSDLFYRLSVVPIRVPALRERLDDIPALAEYFLAEFCSRNNFRSRTLDTEVMAALAAYHWPGNVRELRNVVERMAILSAGERITVDSIPHEMRHAAPRAGGLQEARDSAERGRILQALDQTDWNVSNAARLLGVERTSLHKRIRALGLVRT